MPPSLYITDSALSSPQCLNLYTIPSNRPSLTQHMHRQWLDKCWKNHLRTSKLQVRPYTHPKRNTCSLFFSNPYWSRTKLQYFLTRTLCNCLSFASLVSLGSGIPRNNHHSQTTLTYNTGRNPTSVMTSCDYDSDANFFAYYFPITAPSPSACTIIRLCSLFVSSFVHLAQPRLHSRAHDS